MKYDRGAVFLLMQIKDLLLVSIIAAFTVYTVNVLGFPETSGFIAGVYAILNTVFLVAGAFPPKED